jgi:hypothetical protein
MELLARVRGQRSDLQLRVLFEPVEVLGKRGAVPGDQEFARDGEPQCLGEIGPRAVRITAAQEVIVEVDVDLQVCVARSAVQQPASDPRGADIFEAAIETLSGSRPDRGIHSVAKATEQISERLIAHRSSGLGESRSNPVDEWEVKSKVYIASIGRRACKMPNRFAQT